MKRGRLRELQAQKSLRLTQAIERTHFLSKPVDVPFLPREEFFSLASGPATQVSESQSGRNTPDPTKFRNAI